MRVLFISYGVGGAEALNLLFHNMKNKYAKHSFKNIAISTFATMKLTNFIFIKEDNIFQYIRNESPDLIINERSNGLELQNEITKYCRDNNIVNLTLLDLFGNYQNRFKEIPDYILVPSLSIKEELLIEGFSKQILRVTGNPAFDELSKYKYDRTINFKKPNILFVSQPLKENNLSISQQEVYINYLKVIKETNPNSNVYIKFHPNEDLSNWNHLKIENRQIIQDDFLNLGSNYDLIIGYNSTIMLKTIYMGIPTMFYDINFTENIKQFLIYGEQTQKHKYIDFEKNATEKTSSFIEYILQNMENIK